MKVVDDVYLTPRVRVRAANGNAARKKGATNAVLAPELPDELCPTPATKKGAAGRRGRAKNAAVGWRFSSRFFTDNNALSIPYFPGRCTRGS